jgi:hypothetical protein
LCAGSLHSHDQSENTQASNQGALHHFILPFDKQMPQFLLGTINENKLKEPMGEMQDFSKEVGGKSPSSPQFPVNGGERTWTVMADWEVLRSRSKSDCV